MVDKYAEQQHPAVCVSSHSEDMPQDVCVSINGSGDLDIWPNDLETSMRVASQVGNLYSEFGYAKPLGSRVICYVRYGRTDGRTDRWIDKSNAKNSLTQFYDTQVCVLSLTRVCSVLWQVCRFTRCQVESVTTEVKQLLHVTSSQDEEDTEAEQPVTSKNNSRFVITR